MTEYNFSAPSLALSREMIGELWYRIAWRLQQGAVLITDGQFLAAMEEEYQSLTGTRVQADIRQGLQRAIAAVNGQHPETYLIRGVQNGVDHAFEKGVRTLQWNEARVQAYGMRSIRRFTRRDRVQDLLEEVHVRPDQIDALECVQRATRILHQEDEPLPLAMPSPEPRWEAPALTPPANPLQAPEVKAAIELGEVTPEDAQRRQRQQEEQRSRLRQREQEAIDSRLHLYVAQGILTPEEAESFRQLRQVDQRQKKGEIDAREATSIRNSILQGTARDKLEKKIGQAVDQVVNYLQVFAAMQKIGRTEDDALAFLIRHKQVVVADHPDGQEALGVLQELADDQPLLQKVIDLMDRKDHEIRMMSVRLPPYNYIMSRGQERIDNLTIEVDFLDQLRHLHSEQLAERLNSPEREVRVRPAADMRCLISLVDHLTRRTRFRKEVRMVRLRHSIEEFYRSTTDLQEARRQAEDFLRRRLRRLFPDMPSEELVELRQQSSALIEAVEKQVVEERRVRLEEEHLRAEEIRCQQPQEGEEGELELTEEERRRGMMIARVMQRVAGNYRPVPQRVMPDPEEPERFVIAVRDAESGESKPQLRRGAKRYVVRNRDGFWKVE